MEKLNLDAKHTALILIALQAGIVGIQTQPYPSSEVVAKSASLAKAFREKGGTVIYVRVDLANMKQLPVDVSHAAPGVCQISVPPSLSMIPGSPGEFASRGIRCPS